MRQAAILLVEDEALIRMMLVDMLEELRHRVVAEAGSIEDAQTLAESATFDLAILDINVRGRNIDPIAEIIERRGLPFIFMTGYADSALPSAFAGKPYLQKPCSLERLRLAIGAALNAEP
jgi:CheY-like chemotaxis protein